MQKIVFFIFIFIYLFILTNQFISKNLFVTKAYHILIENYFFLDFISISGINTQFYREHPKLIDTKVHIVILWIRTFSKPVFVIHISCQSNTHIFQFHYRFVAIDSIMTYTKWYTLITFGQMHFIDNKKRSLYIGVFHFILLFIIVFCLFENSHS